MAQQQYGQQQRRSAQQGTDRNDPRQDAQQRQNSGFQSRQLGGGQQGAGRVSGARQQSQEGETGQQYGAQQFQSMAEVALRGTALLWDLQMETARNIMRTQARTAALLGAPDYSDLFRLGDDRARRIFAASAEQMLNSARQTRETVFEVQRQIGRLAEQQTIGIAQEVRDQIQQMSWHTEQGLEEIKQIATSEADRAEDVVDYSLQGESGQESGRDRQQAQFRFEAGRGEARAQAGEHAPGENVEGAANEAANAGAEGEADVQQGEAHIANEAKTQRETRERGRARR